MKRVIFFFSLLFLFGLAQANNIQTVKEGPVHEAFMTQEFGDMILQAVPYQPPNEITEIVPSQTDSKAVWIRGYWAWHKKLGEYLWVSGVWRRPPPGHHWIPGYWKNYAEGWVWIRGFWSPLAEHQLQYLSTPPPNPIDEKVSNPPSPEESYFWVPGVWQYDSSAQEYVWYSGRWELFGEDWLYVPGFYVWREKGCIFTPGFWDWPIEERGECFASVYIDPDNRSLTVYEPNEVLEPLFIVELYYPYWPDYLCFYHYHYFYHHDLWVAWGAVPPWWNWNPWWAFATPDNWWLWWWWCHPGYPNPPWITHKLANGIQPPSEFVLKMMSKVDPPPTVTPNGVVGDQTLFRTIEKISGKKVPILPSDPKQVKHIKELAVPKAPKGPYLRPEGKTRVTTPPDKPFFGPSVDERKTAPRRVKIPERPLAATIQPQSPPQMQQPPQYYPPTKFQHQPQRPVPGIQMRPQHPPPEPPIQGYKPYYQYPQTPMQIEHQDRLMSYPQPQRNPSGPRVHQSPGYESH